MRTRKSCNSPHGGIVGTSRHVCHFTVPSPSGVYGCHICMRPQTVNLPDGILFVVEKAPPSFKAPYWCFICDFRLKNVEYNFGWQFGPRPLYSLRHAQFHIQRHIDAGHKSPSGKTKTIAKPEKEDS